MDVLLDEVESLEAILMDDVKITRNAETGHPEMIETTVLPTVGEDLDSQYVCVTLQVFPTTGYPDIQPKFQLRNPRGLDDSSIDAIRRSIQEKLAESIGSPVVFDLIEVIREHLTESNLPSGQCVVCLYGFQEGDQFTKTVCYHYLHSYCLARHLMASQRNHQEEMDKLPVWQQKLAKVFQPTCPVCRVPIEDDVEPLRKSRPPSDLSNAPHFELTSELKILQAKMATLFQRQKNRGGIIEVGADESNVISIDDEEPEQSDERLKDSADDALSSNTSKLTAHQRVTCRNHRQIQPTAAPAAPAKSAVERKEAKKQQQQDSEDEEEEDGRHRRHHHHHDHHRRGGNRHNRRRQYHTSHSQPQESSAASNGQSSNGSAAR